MQRRAVQALVVVLDDELPVGADVVDDAIGADEIGHAPGGELRRQGAEMIGERRTVRRERDEQNPSQTLDADTVQWKVRLVESGRSVHVRRADQAAVVVVRPRVVRTLDRAGELSAGLTAESRAAMAAHVLEGATPVAVRAHDHDAVAGDRRA